MSFGQLKKLAYLIWLSFSSDFLQVDQLWDVRVHEYVVASSDTVKPKTKSFNKTPEIREGDIPESAGRKLSEQSSTIHAVPQITLGLHFTNSRATTRSFTIAL
jgi:hypothetical protein